MILLSAKEIVNEESCKRGLILRCDATVNPKRRWEQKLKDGRKLSLSIVTQVQSGNESKPAGILPGLSLFYHWMRTELSRVFKLLRLLPAHKTETKTQTAWFSH